MLYEAKEGSKLEHFRLQKRSKKQAKCDDTNHSSDDGGTDLGGRFVEIGQRTAVLVAERMHSECQLGIGETDDAVAARHAGTA